MTPLLCASVRYEVRGALGRAVNCHCAMCRKAHGAAFGTYAGVQDSDFVVLSGRDDIASYRSSAEVIPGVRPALHIFVGSKAPWFDIADDLPQQAYR